MSQNHISGNSQNGIYNNAGGNLELAPPVISGVSLSSVTGTAAPDATVEIYTDPEDEGLVFEGETVSDASGNFTWSGTITGSFTNVTAIAIDQNGNTSMFSQAAVITGVEQSEGSNLPGKFSLSQNAPNPFNPSTRIRFAIPKTCFVTVQVVDLLGREIDTLVHETRTAGVYSIEWDARDHAAGIYLLRMKAGEFAETRKLILQK